MTEKNNKVPIAILSCFLIAFILQGVLKLSGIFIFEKAVDWEIFDIIDKYKWLTCIYYSILMMTTTYCLAFALTKKPYSNKWYHYAILIIASIGITTFRLYSNLTYQTHIVLDVVIFILVPLVIKFTLDTKDRLFGKTLFDYILTITIQIGCYFCYLGLEYWSSLLCSLLPINPEWLTSSTMFLLQLEEYIALISFMLGTTLLVKIKKGEKDMHLPLNIATDEAKVKELQDKKAKKNSKKNEK